MYTPTHYNQDSGSVALSFACLQHLQMAKLGEFVFTTLMSSTNCYKRQKKTKTKSEIILLMKSQCQAITDPFCVPPNMSAHPCLCHCLVSFLICHTSHFILFLFAIDSKYIWIKSSQSFVDLRQMDNANC